MPPAIEAQPAAESANRPDADKEPSVPHQMQLQPCTPLELAVGDGAEHEQESNAGLTPTSFADGAARFLPAPTDFLSWASFGEVTLRPRKNARRSRLDRIISPLKSVGAGLPGNVSVEGLGGLIESAHGIFHSVRRLDFMESERTMYTYSPPTPGPRVPAPDKLPRRELERYENELFDLSKYNGASDYLTAMAWTEEAMSGSLTLYRVLFGIAGEATGVRPVAAMRDVPSQVLARMRTDGRVKRKAVVTLIEDDDRTFDWKANPGRGPRYVRLASSGVRSPGRSNSSRYRGPGMADADGVCATLPQFFALLHSRRSLLENVGSSWVTQTRTEDGEAHPMVFLTSSPQSSPHEGNRVHVAVLVPNDALWAEDEFIWTDQTGLAEFRQRQYWDLIEPESRRARGRSRSRRRERDDAGPTRSPIRGGS
ncbi:uncharacterized protein P884DRAFT_259560 [Thermothelomyces heterothallicus CBS 202.75]|uniref:uncharacterized protein n=1 Tax=Thermothelomyces heterothallicus CBS 202.75 TaxID=1149848 RepID=UPI0037431674